MKYFLGFVALFVAFFTATFAFAADAALPMGDFLSQSLEAIKALGGLSFVGKVASIVMLLIGSMKVDAIRAFVWDKLPIGAKPFLAPGLGLLAGILNLHPITMAGVFAYVSAGAGAIILYELLDAVKVAAASKAIVGTIIGLIQSVLKTGK